MSEPSTPGDSPLATLSVFQFALYFIGGTAHRLNRHRDSLEVTHDLPLITDQEYSSHYRRKIRALYAKVHLNLEKSTTVIQCCLRALVINWQLIDLLQFTQGISIIEKIIHYSFYNFIMTFTLWFSNLYLSRHVRSREAYCAITRLLTRQSAEKRTGHFLFLGTIIGPFEWAEVF